jgi:hypothetical protein
MVRAATVGTHPEFVSMILDLVRERMTASPARAALGLRGQLDRLDRRDG